MSVESTHHQSHQNLLRAADLYVAVLRQYFAEQYADHPQTMIACSSRMAGTLMLRSFAGDLGRYQPGHLLNLPQIQERSAHLSTLLNTTLQQLGDVINFDLAQAALDTNNISRMSLLQTQTEFEPVFTGMANTIGLSLPQAACAACLASAVLVHEAQRKIDLHCAYITAVYGHVEALKTVPAPLRNDEKLDLSAFSPKPAVKKPWYQFWAR